MAKKKGGKKKSAKNAKPSWMSDEIFALTKDLHRLIEHYKGETAGPPLIDTNLVFLHSYPSYPSWSPGRDVYMEDTLSVRQENRRQERRGHQARPSRSSLIASLLVGKGIFVVQSTVKALSESEYKVTAVGLLSTLVKRPNGRDALFAAKPAARLALLLDSVAEGNICLASYTCREIITPYALFTAR